MMFTWINFVLIICGMMIEPPKKYLALGDSYTIGESVAEAERWPNQLVRALEARGMHYEMPRIIATTGWRTDNLRAAMEAAQLKDEYDLVTLLIGVNNQYQGRSVEEYEAEFADLLQRAVKLARGKKAQVLVVSIPDYGYTPFGEKKQAEITKAIDAYNAVNRALTERAGIRYVNITDISREGLRIPGYVAADRLHPSGLMYEKWVARIVTYF
jgi:lysophospholipase L1-like esterase